jgi:hypothetical protein
MTLWMMMFALGLLGFAVTSTKLALNNSQKSRSSMIIIKDENGNERFLIRPN